MINHYLCRTSPPMFYTGCVFHFGMVYGHGVNDRWLTSKSFSGYRIDWHRVKEASTWWWHKSH